MEFLTLFGLLDLPAFVALLVGAFIGWNLPQPIWAQIVSAKIKAYYLKLKTRIKEMFTQ